MRTLSSFLLLALLSGAVAPAAPAPGAGSPREGPGLPARLGPWALHVLAEPRRVELERDGVAQAFDVPVYVYLPADPTPRADEAAALLARLAREGWTEDLAAAVAAWDELRRARRLGVVAVPTEAP